MPSSFGPTSPASEAEAEGAAEGAAEWAAEAGEAVTEGLAAAAGEATEGAAAAGEAATEGAAAAAAEVEAEADAVRRLVISGASRVSMNEGGNEEKERMGVDAWMIWRWYIPSGGLMIGSSTSGNPLSRLHFFIAMS